MSRRHALLAPWLPLGLVLLALALLAASGTDNPPAAASAKPSDDQPAAANAPGRKGSTRAYTTERLRGKVVWLDEALKRLYGVTTEPDAAETAVVLEMADGRLWPIAPDTRGRAFAVDSRLRNTEFEMLVRRYDGVPMIQVIRLFRPTPDGLYEIDYWCDVCAISMFILKDCECCQGPTRLRERKVEPERP